MNRLERDMGYIRITTRVVSETVSIVYREATPEEQAKLRIAQGIQQAEEAMRVACRGVSRKEVG